MRWEPICTTTTDHGLPVAAHGRIQTTASRIEVNPTCPRRTHPYRIWEGVAPLDSILAGPPTPRRGHWSRETSILNQHPRAEAHYKPRQKRVSVRSSMPLPVRQGGSRAATKSPGRAHHILDLGRADPDPRPDEHARRRAGHHTSSRHLRRTRSAKLAPPRDEEAPPPLSRRRDSPDHVIRQWRGERAGRKGG